MAKQSGGNTAQRVEALVRPTVEGMGLLEDKIGFLDIGRLVEAVVDSDSFGGEYTLSDVYECDRMAREFVRAHL